MTTLRLAVAMQGHYCRAGRAPGGEADIEAPALSGVFTFRVRAGVPHFSAVLEGETIFHESGTGPSRNDMIPQLPR